MALLLQVGHQVCPEPTPELLRRHSGRQIGSFVRCPLALCTMALEAQVGQEGGGKAGPMQGCHGRPGGAMLVVTEPQQLLHVLQPRLTGPTCCIRPDDVRGRALRGICDPPADLLGRACARDNHVQRAEGADLQPASLHDASAGGPIRHREVEGGGAAAPQQMAPVAAGFECPARREQATMALPSGGHLQRRRVAGLDDRGAPIVGLDQDDDLDARGGACTPGCVAPPPPWACDRAAPRPPSARF
jgi:hypothetical protein